MPRLPLFAYLSTKSISSFEESSIGWRRWDGHKVEDEKIVIDVVKDEKVGKIVVDVVMVDVVVVDVVDGDVVEVDMVDLRVEVAVRAELIDDHVRFGLYHRLDFSHQS